MHLLPCCEYWLLMGNIRPGDMIVESICSCDSHVRGIFEECTYGTLENKKNVIIIIIITMKR